MRGTSGGRVAAALRAALLCAGLAHGGTAAAQGLPLVDFYGSGVISDLTHACVEQGWTGPAPVEARFRPPDVAANGPATRIVVFAPGFTLAFRLNAGRLDRIFREVEGVYIGSAGFFPDMPPALRLLRQTPALIAPDTPAVTLKLQVQGWYGLRGCNLDLDLYLLRKP
ncbi:MAG: hypothetical protein KJZ85_00020 [Rhodobacteraceae bacterium]|jgi:hypothetical protein|nr:hypothetical protein [Paracoccaceae bacterium]